MNQFYADKFDPDEQKMAEDRVANLIYEQAGDILGEGDAQYLSRIILKDVLTKFRPDLIHKNKPNKV